MLVAERVVKTGTTNAFMRGKISYKRRFIAALPKAIGSHVEHPVFIKVAMPSRSPLTAM